MRVRAILMIGLLFLGVSCGDEDGDSVASGDLPVLPVGGAGGGGAAAGSSAAMRAVAEDSAVATEPGMPMPVERITYRLADGVTGLGGEAPAYRMTAKVDGDAVKALAERLGVDEDEVSVEEQAGVPWSYGGDTPVSSSASAVEKCEPPPPPDCGSDAVCFTACAPPKEPEPPADLPSREEAERIAARILGEDYKVAIEDEATSEGWHAFGIRTVDGMEVGGLEATLLVGSKGKVTYANGYLGQPEKLGDYPLVGAAETQKRLDEWYGGGGGDTAVARDAIGAPEPAMEDPGMTTPTSIIERTVELASVKVVLQFVPGYCSGDPGYLVPAYETTPEEFVIPAVADSALGEGPDGDDAKGAEPCPGDEPGQIEPGVEPDPAPMPEPAPAPPSGATEPNSGEADPGR